MVGSDLSTFFAGDILAGDAGPNRILGLAGDDTLTSRGGADLLLGGSGRDTFLFRSGDGDDRADSGASLDLARIGQPLAVRPGRVVLTAAEDGEAILAQVGDGGGDLLVLRWAVDGGVAALLSSSAQGQRSQWVVRRNATGGAT